MLMYFTYTAVVFRLNLCDVIDFKYFKTYGSRNEYFTPFCWKILKYK